MGTPNVRFPLLGAAIRVHYRSGLSSLACAMG
jgi:hypothetical protein